MVRQVTLQLSALMLCGAAQAADVTLAWDPSPDPVTGYIVFWSTADVLQYPGLASSAQIGNVLQYQIFDLQPARRYYFAVKARYYNNLSGFSNQVSYTTPAAGSAPAAPVIKIKFR